MALGPRAVGEKKSKTCYKRLLLQPHFGRAVVGIKRRACELAALGRLGVARKNRCNAVTIVMTKTSACMVILPVVPAGEQDKAILNGWQGVNICSPP